MEAQAALADLDPDQRAAVLSDGAPLCVVAPAGSGKTRVLTQRVARRILDGSADAGHVLVLTFTRRAAEELGRRLRAVGPREPVAAGTFHGIAYRLLRQRWEDQRRQAPSLLTNRERVVAEVLTEPRGPRFAHEITMEIDWARARMVRPDRYAATAADAHRRPLTPLHHVADVYARYEDAKRRRRMVDFDDLLALARHEVDSDPRYAAAVRWRFRHFFVDEFQDVNPLQHALLEAWRGGRDDYCVVGDPSQAIYGWTGADGGWLDDFAEHHPHATVIHLGRSHRSSPQIVTFGHAVLTGSVDGGPAASRPDGPRPRIHHFADASAEATGVAALAREARSPGGRWSAVAVLARTHAQLVPVAEAMARSGIPHRGRGGSAFDDPALSPLLSELRSARGRGALRASLDEMLSRREENRRAGEPEGLGAKAADDDAPAAPLVPAWLLRSAEDLLAQEPHADGAALAAWLATGGHGDGLGGDDDAVGLLTFHAAKGLQWPAVIVIGAVPGLVPHGSARRASAHAEERRLFHVAVTRAERELHVTWYGAERSPFLAPADVLDEPGVPPPPDVYPSRPNAPLEPLLAELRAWRRDVARAARIDERAVVDDRTLAAVAEARPTSLDSLAAISGFGPLMAARHGPRLLAVIQPVVGST